MPAAGTQVLISKWRSLLTFREHGSLHGFRDVLCGEHECQNGEDESIEDSDDGEDIRPADTASTEIELCCIAAADTLDLVVFPAQRVNNTTEEHTETCKKLMICLHNEAGTKSGLALDILKKECWAHMGRTANIIIKDIYHIFASLSDNMRILLMGQRYHKCCKCLPFCWWHFANAFSWMKITVFWYKFPWSLSLMVLLKIGGHWKSKLMV